MAQSFNQIRKIKLANYYKQAYYCYSESNYVAGPSNISSHNAHQNSSAMMFPPWKYQGALEQHTAVCF